MEHPLHCDQSELLVEYREDTPDDGHCHMDSLLTVTLVEQETDAPDSSDWLDQPKIYRGNRARTVLWQEISRDTNEQIPAIPVDSSLNQEKLSAEPVKLEPNTWDDAPCKLVHKDRGEFREDLHFDLCQSDNQGPIGAPYVVVLHQSQTSSKLIEEKEKMECGKLDGLLNDQELVSAVPNMAHSPEHTSNRIPTSDKPYRCIVCNYRCEQLSDFLRHSRKHAEVSYQCQLKYQEYLNKPGHIDEKPYKCSRCEYSADLQRTLSQHMRTHAGERPYKCSWCDYSAAVKSTLSKHMRTHTGEKPYKCSQCDYIGATKGDLSQHMRKHTGDKPLCDYKSVHMRVLSNHVKGHTGEKLFRCSQCYYRSDDKAALSEHMLRHTCERAYKCSWCDYKSDHKAILSRHMLRHTKDKAIQIFTV